jgi:NADPH:quinone reductase-like Zn-dependent oxidoreductase
MRQVVITRHGGPDVMHVREAPDPEPGPGEIRIRVKAAGVNFADVLARMGLYPDAPKPPMVVGYEVSGHVDANGPGPVRFEKGRAVLALTPFRGYADTVVVPSDLAFPVPPTLTHNEAAAIPVNYLTAFVALYRMANVKAGETVLVHGAGGGVGIAATQLARLRRAAIIGTASASKHNALRSFGVDHAIDYRSADVAKEVARITGGRGVDVVLDPIGGDSFARSYRMLAPLGRLIVYGVSDMVGGDRRSLWRLLRSLWNMPKFGPLRLMNENRGVFGLNLGHLWTERKLLAGTMDSLLADFGSGRLKPVVSKTFPLDRAPDAHRFLQSRANIGKVILTT